MNVFNYIYHLNLSIYHPKFHVASNKFEVQACKTWGEVDKAIRNIRQNGGINYLRDGESSEYLIKSSLTIFTNSRQNFEPEKLHSEGKANKLYALPAQVGHKIKMKLWKLLQNWCYRHRSHNISQILWQNVQWAWIFPYLLNANKMDQD